MKGIILALFLVCFGLTYGYSRFRREIPNGYGVQHPCPGKGHWDAVGHMSGGYTPRKNTFGQTFRDGGKRWTAEICNQDSDGDGLTNGEELGDPQCKWRPGDPSPGPARGHPGFCEPDRQKCDSGMTHAECPNPRARGQGQGRTPARTLPPGANDHPQTFLSKNMDRGGSQSFGQSQSGFGMGQSQPSFGTGQQRFGNGGGMSFGQTTAPSFPPQQPSFRSTSGGFGMSSGGFDSSSGGGFGGASGGASRFRSVGQSFSLPTSDSQSFRPPSRTGSFSSGGGGSDASSFGLSRDFGLSSDSQFLGAQSSGMSRGGPRAGFRDRMDDFSMVQTPGMDRFSSSLDQRAIQGIGSPMSRPSFTSSMSRSEIERSVQARMGRERSRFGGAGMGPGSRGVSGMSSRGFQSSGMDSGGMGSSDMGSVGIGSSGMGSDGMGSGGEGPGFAGGMGAQYPPFMSGGFSGGTSGFGGPSFSGDTSMSGRPGMRGGSFSGGMSMPGGSGMPGMSGDGMMPGPFPTF